MSSNEKSNLFETKITIRFSGRLEPLAYNTRLWNKDNHEKK